MVSVAFKENLKGKHGIKSNDESLLEDAFTHSSYADEHPGRKDYGKLEFLGDTVLELAVSGYLYRHLPRLDEGELTRTRPNIVRTEGFSESVIECGFPAGINLGKGEEKAGARKRKTLLEDVSEASSGTLFLDQGIPVVQHFLHLTVYLLTTEGDFNASRGYKTEPQERLQVSGSVKIEYQVTAKDESKPSSRMQLFANDKKISGGQGRNKKAAKQQATQAALDRDK